jgi:hypothetical protein
MKIYLDNCSFFVGGQGTPNRENEDPDGNGDWLHRNNSYQTHYVDVENISTQIPGVVLFNLLLADLNIGSSFSYGVWARLNTSRTIVSH